MLRREVVGFVMGTDVCQERTEDIRLAVSEALSNAVIHAYRHADEPGKLEVSAARTARRRRGHRARLRQRDGPARRQPGPRPRPALIEHTTDCYEIQCADGTTGTEIRMRFDC